MDLDKPKKLQHLERILKFMALAVLKKYRPRIIGITGSVGKTSTKEAVFTVLASHFRVRRNEKNYNNELGLPLTVMGVESGGNSFLGWLKVTLEWLWLIVFPVKYPQILVLEMAADRPRDIKYLVDFIRPQIGVITDISGSHMEYFGSLAGIAEEKGYLAKSLPNNGVAVLNVDNPQLKKMKDQSASWRTKVISFGFSEGADIRATDVFYNYTKENHELRGLSFKLNYKGTSIPMRLNNVLAAHSIYAALAGVAVGIKMGLNLVAIGEALENFVLPTGRMNLIRGIKNTLIIDDTYNASPASTKAALKVLADIKASRKIAVLGDMLELGVGNDEGHREVAREFLKIENGIFLAVGSRMQLAVSELKKHNISHGRIVSFKSSLEAGPALKNFIREGDLILVKGSQGMRMEKVVEEVMAEPDRAPELLCRQDKKWKARSWQAV